MKEVLVDLEQLERPLDPFDLDVGLSPSDHETDMGDGTVPEGLPVTDRNFTDTVRKYVYGDLVCHAYVFHPQRPHDPNYTRLFDPSDCDKLARVRTVDAGEGMDPLPSGIVYAGGATDYWVGREGWVEAVSTSHGIPKPI